MPNELDILEKCRLAEMAVLVNAGIDAAIVRNGKSTEPKELPLVICLAESSREEPFGTGNFWVDLVVEIKTTGREADSSASNLLVANVMAALEVDNLAALLTAGTANFTVFGFGEEKSQDLTEAGVVWVHRWMRRAYVCGAAL